MIYAAVSHIALSLNEMLKKSSSVNEDIVVISNLVEQDGSVPIQAGNKVVVSLVNLERDTLPMGGGGSISGLTRSVVRNQPVYLNIYLMFSLCFSGNNYMESLKYLSATIAFFQRRPVFDHSNSPDLDRRIDRLMLDIENLDIQELSNLWGVLGGKYLPSVLYKVRMLAIDPGDVQSQVATISRTPDAKAGS